MQIHLETDVGKSRGEALDTLLAALEILAEERLNDVEAEEEKEGGEDVEDADAVEEEAEPEDAVEEVVEEPKVIKKGGRK
jgi:hypothetical protein